MQFRNNELSLAGSRFGRIQRRGLSMPLGLLVALAPGCSGGVSKHNSQPALPAAVDMPIPAVFRYQADSLTLTKGGQLICPGPSGTHWKGASFTVEPALPKGLTLDPATGGISGWLVAASPAAVYKVTATKAGQISNASLTIKVRDNASRAADDGRSGAPGA